MSTVPLNASCSLVRIHAAHGVEVAHCGLARTSASRLEQGPSLRQQVILHRLQDKVVTLRIAFQHRLILDEVGDILGREQRQPHAGQQAGRLGPPGGQVKIHPVHEGLEAVFRIHGILEWIRIRGSMPLTNGSGFGSGSWIRILLISSLTFMMPTKNNLCLNLFSAYYCLKVHLPNFPKIKSQKESQNSRNQGFSYYCCMMTEGSGSETGSIPLTNGSGSGRPKNMWIRWIRNTAWKMISSLGTLRSSEARTVSSSRGGRSKNS